MGKEHKQSSLDKKQNKKHSAFPADVHQTILNKIDN